MKLKTILTLLAGLLLSTQLSAKTCELSIAGTDQIKYNTRELKVGSDCEAVRLTLRHAGTLAVAQMGHNWTLTRAEDWKDVTQAGRQVTIETEYLPPDDPRILASTKLIGGGETATIDIDMSKLEKGGDYTFFCSFSSHWATMNGKFIVE